MKLGFKMLLAIILCVFSVGCITVSRLDQISAGMPSREVVDELGSYRVILHPFRPFTSHPQPLRGPNITVWEYELRLPVGVGETILAILTLGISQMVYQPEKSAYHFVFLRRTLIHYYQADKFDRKKTKGLTSDEYLIKEVSSEIDNMIIDQGMARQITHGMIALDKSKIYRWSLTKDGILGIAETKADPNKEK